MADLGEWGMQVPPTGISQEAFEEQARHALHAVMVEQETEPIPYPNLQDFQEMVPKAIRVMSFVLWLRRDTDFFSGPNLDQHHPQWDSEDFLKVLALNTLMYTGEFLVEDM